MQWNDWHWDESMNVLRFWYNWNTILALDLDVLPVVSGNQILVRCLGERPLHVGDSPFGSERIHGQILRQHGPNMVDKLHPFHPDGGHALFIRYVSALDDPIDALPRTISFHGRPVSWFGITGISGFAALFRLWFGFRILVDPERFLDGAMDGTEPLEYRNTFAWFTRSATAIRNAGSVQLSVTLASHCSNLHYNAGKSKTERNGPIP